MTLEQRLIALAQAMGADVKALLQAQGSLSALSTTAKNNLVAAINELKTAVDAAAGGGVSINDGAGDGATGVTWSELDYVNEQRKTIGGISYYRWGYAPSLKGSVGYAGTGG